MNTVIPHIVYSRRLWFTAVTLKHAQYYVARTILGWFDGMQHYTGAIYIHCRPFGSGRKGMQCVRHIGIWMFCRVKSFKLITKREIIYSFIFQQYPYFFLQQYMLIFKTCPKMKNLRERERETFFFQQYQSGSSLSNRYWYSKSAQKWQIMKEREYSFFFQQYSISVHSFLQQQMFILKIWRKKKSTSENLFFLFQQSQSISSFS